MTRNIPQIPHVLDLWRDDPKAIASMFAMARALEAQARAAGFLAMVSNAAFIIRGPGQWTVWSAAPGPRGWLCLWWPRRGCTPSQVGVRDAQSAQDMIGMALRGEARARRARRGVLVVDGVEAVVRRPTVELAVVRRRPAGLVNSEPDSMPRPRGCVCTWEPGDSPCPVHGQDE